MEICLNTNYSYIPLYGDLNFTPSSVILASSNNDTIWKPPESVNKALFQFINLCKPPAFSKVLIPYKITFLSIIHTNHNKIFM